MGRSSEHVFTRSIAAVRDFGMLVMLHRHWMFSASREIRGFLSKQHWSGATDVGVRNCTAECAKKGVQAGRDAVHILGDGLPTAFALWP